MCVLKVQNFPISALAGLYDLQPSVLGGEDLGQIQIGIYPQHFQNILADQNAICDQTWEHTKGNTDVFMWLGCTFYGMYFLPTSSNSFSVQLPTTSWSNADRI